MRKKKTPTGLTNTIRSSLKCNREDIMRQNSRKKRGRPAHDSGKNLEKKLEALCFWYRDDEEPEWEFVRNYEGPSTTGKGTSNYATSVNSCDFSFFASNNFGWILGGMIEAKNRNGNRINKSALSHYQKDQLIRMEKLGHCGFILACLVENEVERHFLVPIQYWYRGAKTSHNCADLEIVGYELDLIKINDDNGHEVMAPDILKCLKLIDSEGVYKKLPSKYKENYDQTKLHPKRGKYSTIDSELENITDVE